MEKQVATLGKDLAALKSGIAKDAAKSRAKQEAMLSEDPRESQASLQSVPSGQRNAKPLLATSPPGVEPRTNLAGFADRL